jgi:predicted RNA polymerase sigma factor
MTAVLCSRFGLQHIEVAEDIASDTFLKASENWAIDGVPKILKHGFMQLLKIRQEIISNQCPTGVDVFQSSRLDARIDGSGETVLFDKQDKSLWIDH